MPITIMPSNLTHISSIEFISIDFIYDSYVTKEQSCYRHFEYAPCALNWIDRIFYLNVLLDCLTN